MEPKARHQSHLNRGLNIPHQCWRQLRQQCAPQCGEPGSASSRRSTRAPRSAPREGIKGAHQLNSRSISGTNLESDASHQCEKSKVTAALGAVSAAMRISKSCIRTGVIARFYSIDQARASRPRFKMRFTVQSRTPICSLIPSAATDPRSPAVCHRTAGSRA